MKQKLFFAATILLLSLFALASKKRIKNIIPPPFAYSIYTVDATIGKVRAKLESSSAAYQKPKGKENAATYNITGAKSSLRLKIADAVFQSDSEPSTGTLNPANYIGLYKLSVGKSNRSFTMNSDGSSISMIPVTFTSLDQLSNRIAVSGAILPGEYAFVDRTTTDLDGNVKVWTFGID